MFYVVISAVCIYGLYVVAILQEIFIFGLLKMAELYSAQCDVSSGVWSETKARVNRWRSVQKFACGCESVRLNIQPQTFGGVPVFAGLISVLSIASGFQNRIIDFVDFFAAEANIVLPLLKQSSTMVVRIGDIQTVQPRSACAYRE